MDTPTLTDGTVTLDALGPDDAEPMVASYDEPTRWAWDRDKPLTTDEAREWIEEAAAHWRNNTRFQFAIRPASDAGAFAGRLDLVPAQAGDGGRIGIIVAPVYRRRHLAARAVELATPFAFEQLDWPFVIAEIKPENEASRALAESVGYRFLRTFDDPRIGTRHFYFRHREGDVLFTPLVTRLEDQ